MLRRRTVGILLGAVSVCAAYAEEGFDPDMRLRAVSVLRAGMASEEFWPSMHAAEALTAAGFGMCVIHDLMPRLQAETDAQRRCGLSREIIRAGDLRPLPGMVEILKDPATTAPVHVCESLFKVHQVGDLAAMRRHLQSDNRSEELMAAAALARAGQTAELARIRKRLQPPNDETTRRIAAWILGQIGGREDWPAIQVVAESAEDGLARSFAWNALAKLGHEEARDRVAASLTADDKTIRTYAAQTMGTCGLPAHLPALANMLADENLDSRIRAAEAIVRITGRMLGIDTDGDSIPDCIEAELGTPQDDAEALTRFHDAKPVGPGSADPEALPPELIGAWFGHVGGDRCVWVYEFGSSVSEQRTVFHSYVHLDADLTNGRQDSQFSRGVDAMYSFVDAHNDPRIFTKSLRTHPEWPVRGIVAGNRIYVCDDVFVTRRDDHAEIRVSTLSERYPNARTTKKVGKGTPMRTVKARLRSQRKPPALDYPSTQGFTATAPNYTLRYRLRYGEGTVALNLAAAERADVIAHYNGDVETPKGAAGRVDVTLPVTGRYRLALFGRAIGAGGAGLDISLAGRPVGTVAAGNVGPPGTLFYSEPLAVQEGTVLTMRSSPRGAAGRFGDMMLIRTEPKLPELCIANLQSVRLPARPGEARDRLEVVWTTNWSVECDVAVEQGGQTLAFESLDGAGVNHRFLVPAELAEHAGKLTVTTRTTERLPSIAASLRTSPNRPRPGLAAQRSGRVPLEVSETTAAGRTAWPVTSGIPFARGTLAEATRCRVLDAGGQALPGQFRALSLWPDGSVKWLLVDTLVATRAHATSELTLEYNVDPFVPAGVRVVESKQSVELDTGSMQLTLDRACFEPFVKVVVGGQDRSAPGALTAVDAEGREFTSAGIAPDEIVVEESGPVRATVRVRGAFADAEKTTWMRYLCRLHVVAGQAGARLEITFENSELKPQMSLVSRFGLPLRFPGLTSIDAGQGPCKLLLQDYDNRFLVDGKARQGRAAGYCIATHRAGATVVAVRDFWQLYPKAFQVRPDGALALGLLPPLPAEQYRNDDDQKLVDRLYYWCDQGRYKLRSGMRFTTDLSIAFGPQSDAAAFNDWIQNPLFAAATPAHYCGSGVFGNLVPRNPEAFTRYEGNVDKAFEEFTGRREDKREYGFMNFGDWYGERTWNWGNVEYDTHFALALHFMRTGHRASLLRADEAAFHNGDVDTLHYASSPHSVGRVWVHSLGHTGGYFPSEFKNMGGFATGGSGAGHTWCRGHFLLWALTGNERYRDAGEKVARYQAVELPRKVSLGTNRDGGWTLIGALGAYQVSGDPFYLNGAKALLERILDKQRPNGQWGHSIWECRDVSPRPWGCKPFMTGVILHSLAMLDRTEPNARARDAIRRGATYLWDKTYVRDQHGFIYAEAPRFQGRGGVWTLMLTGDGLSRACNYDPKQTEKSLLIDALSHTMYRGGVSSFGKTFTQGLCFMPFMLAELTELGIENPPPVVTPPELRLRSHAILPPGESLVIRPVLRNGEDAARTCRLSFDQAAAPFLGGQHVFVWDAVPGWSLGPEIRVTVPAEPGALRFAVSAEIGGKGATRPFVIEAATPTGAVGNAIGWVSAPKDHLAVAAGAVGIEAVAVSDVAKADLSRFGAIVLGAEAHEKNYAGCRAASARLARFVVSGGTLLVGQINDASWVPDYLPRDLVPGDDGTEAGAVLVPEHAIFAELTTGALAGVQSFDRFDWAAPGWRVLMAGADGSPAVLQTEVGKGRVLVVMPSFDRVAVAAEDSASRKAARALMANLLRWAGATH